MQVQNVTNREKRDDIIKAILFVFITFGISWSMWLLSSNVVLQSIACCMPAIIGFIFLRLNRSSTYKYYGRRMISLHLVKLPWMILIILIFPLITVVSIVICKLLGGEVVSSFTQNIQNPMTIITIVVVSGLGAGLGEELGWRGFLLDTIQKYCNGLVSGIIVGVIWASWHIAIYISNKINIFCIDFANYFIFVVLVSILFTVVYYNNNRSILSVIILHAMVNITSGMFFLNTSKPVEQSIIETICLLLILIILILVCKAKAPYTFDMIKSKKQNT